MNARPRRDLFGGSLPMVTTSPLRAQPCPWCDLWIEWSAPARRWMEYASGRAHWCPVARVAVRTFPLPIVATECDVESMASMAMYGHYAGRR